MKNLATMHVTRQFFEVNSPQGPFFEIKCRNYLRFVGTKFQMSIVFRLISHRTSRINMDEHLHENLTLSPADLISYLISLPCCKRFLCELFDPFNLAL